MFDSAITVTKLLPIPIPNADLRLPEPLRDRIQEVGLVGWSRY